MCLNMCPDESTLMVIQEFLLTEVCVEEPGHEAGRYSDGHSNHPMVNLAPSVLALCLLIFA